MVFHPQKATCSVARGDEVQAPLGSAEILVFGFAKNVVFFFFLIHRCCVIVCCLDVFCLEFRESSWRGSSGNPKRRSEFYAGSGLVL